MTSVILGSTNGFTAGATTYLGLASYNAVSSTENDRKQLCSSSGTLQNTRVKLTTAPGAGKSAVFTLRKNGVDTAITCTISDSATTASDTSNTVTVAAGDTLGWSCALTAAGVSSFCELAIEYVGDTANESQLMGGSEQAFSNADGTLSISGNCTQGDPDDTFSDQVIATAGTIKNLYVKLTAAPGVGKTRTYTVFINGSSTAITCTISDAATTANDTTHSVSVSAGDRIAVRQPTTGSPNTTNIHLGLTFVATTDGQFPILAGAGNSLPATGATRFSSLAMNDTPNTPYSATDVVFNTAPVIYLLNMYANVAVAPSAGKNWAFTVNKNTSATGLTCTIADAATTANVTSTVTGALFDLYSMQVTPTGTPTAPSRVRWGVTATMINPITFTPQVYYS